MRVLDVEIYWEKKINLKRQTYYKRFTIIHTKNKLYSISFISWSTYIFLGGSHERSENKLIFFIYEETSIKSSSHNSNFFSRTRTFSLRSWPPLSPISKELLIRTFYILYIFATCWLLISHFLLRWYRYLCWFCVY